MSAIVLASASPRRRELLAGLGFEVDVMVHDIDEKNFDNAEPSQRVVDLAMAKAKCVLAEGRTNKSLILGADTLVCDPSPYPPDSSEFSDESGSLTLGKPRDREEAAKMLRLLAGRTHSVHTGIAVIDPTQKREEWGLSTSQVRFAALSKAEIEDYLDSGEWEGVAGAYRIQGLAALFIEEIRGSWSGIVGLPIHELYAILTRLSIKPPALLLGEFPLFGAR